MEIKKLADVVAWADNWIEGMKIGLTEEEFAEDEEVKAFEAVKKVVLESMERHSVYTSALNKDIAEKAAKIEKLEKEIEGRKRCIHRLENQVTSLNEELREQDEKIEKLTVDLDFEREKYEKLAKATAENESMFRKRIMEKNDAIKKLKESIEEWKNQGKEIEKFTKGEENDHGRAGFKRYIEHLIEEEEGAFQERFKERLGKEITEIFTKEEKTEVRIFDEYHKYNWFPCGEDSIE